MIFRRVRLKKVRTHGVNPGERRTQVMSFVYGSCAGFQPNRSKNNGTLAISAQAEPECLVAVRAGRCEQGNDAVRFVSQIMLFLLQVGRQGGRNGPTDSLVYRPDTGEQSFLGLRFRRIGARDSQGDSVCRGSMQAVHLVGNLESHFRRELLVRQFIGWPSSGRVCAHVNR